MVCSALIILVVVNLAQEADAPRLSGKGFGIWRGLGFRVWGLGFRVWGFGFRVWGLGFRVWGLGFRARRGP